MSYDSWKLGNGIDPRSEELADRCANIESFVDRKLGQVIAQTNLTSETQWEAEPVLAEWGDDGGISLEVSLRLKGVPAGGNFSDLQELADAFLKLGDALAQVARGSQTAHGLKLAPSVQNRGSQQSGLG